MSQAITPHLEIDRSMEPYGSDESSDANRPQASSPLCGRSTKNETLLSLVISGSH
jgi:hypothetical protein